MGKLHPTNIQWCTHTVNPVVAVDRETGERGWDEAELQSVLRRRKPATIFWCDMADLFHERVPDEWIDRCFAVMALTPHLRHIVLTKRPERMRAWADQARPHIADVVRASIREDGPRGGRMYAPYANDVADSILGLPGTVHGLMWPLPNVAIGTSVANQEDADTNIPHLLNTPAALRFVNYEPATGDVLWDNGVSSWLTCAGQETEEEACEEYHFTFQHFHGIDAIIIGGESGANARPFDIAWARNTIAQCEEADVVAMVKQLGRTVRDQHTTCADSHDPAECWPEGFRLDPADAHHVKLRDNHGGDPSEWPEDLRPYAASVEKWPWGQR